jgi:Cu2+-containing amine oxidase
MDGAIEQAVHTTGYPQANVWSPSHKYRYGHPMQYNISGTIHDHMLHWKVDLDIGRGTGAAGVNNSVRIDEMKVELTHDKQ